MQELYDSLTKGNLFEYRTSLSDINNILIDSHYLKATNTVSKTGISPVLAQY